MVHLNKGNHKRTSLWVSLHYFKESIQQALTITNSWFCERVLYDFFFISFYNRPLVSDPENDLICYLKNVMYVLKCHSFEL